MTIHLRIQILLFVAILSLQINAQEKNPDVFHPDRYRLDLPRDWNRTKMIEAVTEVLSQTIDELKNKDFCTECRGIYTVRLYID